MKARIFLFIAAFGTLLASCSSAKSASGKVYKKNVHASYYADKFNGRKTASGEKFHNSNYTAAHKKLPFGTKVKVTNIANEKSVIVEINDRGPFTLGREIDLTKKAFMEIADNKNHGSLRVSLEIIK
ncbi:septal ring lytic transglycosylase RlpA family protein [Flavobacterium microcysteis]|uniref:Probable endolytic peptidoglycan transglycosylase RlpA n=1 Tax=Flavobacterium microcysteis TaxID=2596891 RepID=A0A501QLS1_9FLAO|nr:septal ring lytic transglycosylase RlpA family protein [Flavobacterium microcysteis]TPD73689.1 septal ring lytic transglycosylase RlpA family protein [Flavobacterium microcysteis]